MTIYTLTCPLTAETQTVCVCSTHAREMPLIDGDRVMAEPAAELASRGQNSHATMNTPTLQQALAWREKYGIGSSAICGDDYDAIERYAEAQACARRVSTDVILSAMLREVVR